MEAPVEILLVEDNGDDVALIRRQLAQSTLAGATLTNVARLAAAKQYLADRRPSVILLDLYLPDARGLSTLTHLAEAARAVPIIILTGLDDEALAVAAMKLGAQDYLVKDHLPQIGLARAIRQAIERQQLVVDLAAAIGAREAEFAERQQAEQESARLRTAFDVMAEGAQIIGADWRYIYLNDAAAAQSRRPKQELLGRTLLEAFPGIERTPLFESLQRCMEQRTPEYIENPVTYTDGSHGWFGLSVQPTPDGIFVLSSDITARKEAELALRDANERLTHSLAELGRRGRELALLSQMSELLQLCLSTAEAGAVVAQFAREFFPVQAGALYLAPESGGLMEDVARWGQAGAQPPGFAFMPNDCWALRRGQVHEYPGVQGALVCRHVSQEAAPTPSAYTCVPIVAQGKTLGLLHLRCAAAEAASAPPPAAGLVAAVAEHVALALANLTLRETLREQSIRDPLTGLFNRRFVEATLDREFQRAARQSKPVGVLLADIDAFRTYNETHGREAGDAVLRAVGDLLRGLVRGEDLACRLGGEEFALILPEVPLEGLRERAEQLRAGAQQLEPFHRDQRLVGVTLSTGVAVFPAHGLTAAHVLQAANAALTAAKSAGRNQVAVAAA